MALRTQKLRSSQRLGAHKSFKYICDDLEELLKGLEPMVKNSDMRFKQAHRLIRTLCNVIDSMGKSKEECLWVDLNNLASVVHRTAATFQLKEPVVL